MVSTIRMLAAAVIALALSGAARAEEAQFDFVLRGIKAGSLAWAGEGGGDLQALEQQQIELRGADGRGWRFTVPRVKVAAEALRGIETRNRWLST